MKIAALFLFGCMMLANAQSFDRHSNGVAPTDRVDTANAITISNLMYEVNTVYADGFWGVGLNLRAQIYEQFSIGVRLSYDGGAGTIFSVPYIRCDIGKIGGFEYGRPFRPDVYTWTVPYYEAWRIWIGREDVFTLSASVLMNTPLIGTGYYDGGIGIGTEGKDKFWFGFASIDRALGPAVKTQWYAGEHSWVQAQGSVMLIDRFLDRKRYSLLIGWRQEF